jgi:hypothetical protein
MEGVVRDWSRGGRNGALEEGGFEFPQLAADIL